MTRITRPLVLSLLFGATLFAAGCGKSSNEGKIVGKWKLLSAPGLDESQMKMAEALGMSFVFDFKPDGTLVAGLEAKDAELAKMIEKGGEKTSQTGKYKLLSGDDVEFSGMGGGKGGGGLFGKTETSRLKIKIDGDNMTMTGSDGTGNLTRMK